MARKAYRALVGINYPGRSGEKRAEPGDVVRDIPESAVAWLLDQGHIEPVKDGE